jgi:act minimal PKS acyl carrier protein
MTELTIDDLLRILAESAGQSPDLGAGADPSELSDRPFDELGYDSLALLETAAHIEQELGVALPDEEITELKTPRALLELVNGRLTGPTP